MVVKMLLSYLEAKGALLEGFSIKSTVKSSLLVLFNT